MLLPLADIIGPKLTPETMATLQSDLEGEATKFGTSRGGLDNVEVSVFGASANGKIAGTHTRMASDALKDALAIMEANLTEHSEALAAYRANTTAADEASDVTFKQRMAQVDQVADMRYGTSGLGGDE